MISESVRSAEIQAILARGDRKISAVVMHSEGAQEFRRNFKAAGLDVEFYLRSRDFDEPLPWSFLNQGFSEKYLRDEFNRAAEFKSTAPCFDGCKRCGICH